MGIISITTITEQNVTFWLLTEIVCRRDVNLDYLFWYVLLSYCTHYVGDNEMFF